ncbi:hypothetical protein [Spirillospora sp. CA-294931]|uniref:hypothetical protein n=1 Tax=Spirillospora sp. CA-294931 TaxID=3240042 RepID=UPI003D92F25D
MMEDLNSLRAHHRSRPSPTPDAVITARARLTAEFTPRPTRKRRRYFALATVIAATTTAAVLAPVFMGGDTPPERAYAAERLSDGRIKVTIREFTDAPGLQRRLAELGVRSLITYVPEEHRCTSLTMPVDDSMDRQPMVVEHPYASADESKYPKRVKDWVFYVQPKDIRPGQTLVWSLSFNPRDLKDKPRPRQTSLPRSGTLGVPQSHTYLGRGPIKPCNPVHITAWRGYSEP